MYLFFSFVFVSSLGISFASLGGTSLLSSLDLSLVGSVVITSSWIAFLSGKRSFCDHIFRKIMTKLKSDFLVNEEPTLDLENLKIKIKVYNDKTKSTSNANFNEEDGAWFSAIFKMVNKIVYKVRFTFFSFKTKEIGL